MNRFFATMGLGLAVMAFGPVGIAAAQDPGPAPKVTTAADTTSDQGQVPFPAKLQGKGMPTHTVASATRSINHLFVPPDADTLDATTTARDTTPGTRATPR